MYTTDNPGEKHAFLNIKTNKQTPKYQLDTIMVFCLLDVFLHNKFKKLI